MELDWVEGWRIDWEQECNKKVSQRVGEGEFEGGALDCKDETCVNAEKSCWLNKTYLVT